MGIGGVTYSQIYVISELLGCFEVQDKAMMSQSYVNTSVLGHSIVMKRLFWDTDTRQTNIPTNYEFIMHLWINYYKG